MQLPGRAARWLWVPAVLCWLALCCTSGLIAQQPAKPDGAAAEGTQPRAGAGTPNPGIHGIVNLDDQWRFHTGDDLLWAEPTFDDSSWPSVNLNQTLPEQGLDIYSGYGWYRLKLQPAQVSQISNLAGGEQLALLLKVESVGQIDVYVNGLESGHTRGMTDSPAEFQSPALLVPLNPSLSGPTVIAIRTWAGPATTINHGLLDRGELGALNVIADRAEAAKSIQWDTQVIAPVFLGLLFLGVGILGASLYLSQRHHSEYLWLALLCLSAAALRATRALFGLGLVSLSVYRAFSVIFGFVFVAITLEFVLRFTGSRSIRLVRAVQIAVLIVPLVLFLPSDALFNTVSVAGNVTFCIVVTALLFRSWRGGRGEAGVMLLPFFLAAGGDSISALLDFAVDRHWLTARFASHPYHLGPILYSIGNVTDLLFLCSLGAV